MTSEPVKCPHCGQTAKPANTVHVDLDVNRLYFAGQELSLWPRLAEVAHILARRMPNVVRHETIISEMWGANEGQCVQKSVDVAVCQLRKLLQPLGIQIVNVWSLGFRMEVVSRSERSTQPKESRYAHA